MLLLASVHRAILADDPATRLLAAYFPTVGGFRSPLASELAPLFRLAVHACRQQLVTDFVSSTVQTNESSRGLCWYLPLLYTGLTAVHLVDLGCSAGINLVADLRQYRLCANAAGDSDICLGKGEGEPFVIAHHGAFFAPQQGPLPRVFSRLGYDRLPLRLNSQADKLRLLSFVWGDQVQRLHQLRQGMEAVRSLESSAAPVRLISTNLPGGLEALLDAQFSANNRDAVVLYNSYLTSYLPCKGAELVQRVSNWAKQRAAPVIWFQWEPLRQGPTPPTLGWLGWTADVWLQGVWRRWHLAWVHPHGACIQWLPGLADWAQFWCRPSDHSNNMVQFSQ